MINPSAKNIKFGTDGWRAVIGEDFTFENVRIAAHAVGRTFKDAKKRHARIYIGYDHRFLAPEFAREAAKVLANYNFEPRLLPQAVTSPWLSFLTWKEKALFGVMITASHNPAEYCGFKLKGSFGGSISQETAERVEKSLQQILNNPELIHAHRAPIDWNKLRSLTDFKDTSLTTYTKYLKSHVDAGILRRLRGPVVFDAMYGPGQTLVREFFRALGGKLKLRLIHEGHDPLFGGLHPEPIEDYLGGLKEAVKSARAVGGFALDGDGDRLGVVDEKGNYFTPQQVFALLLYYLAKEKKLKGKVVQAVSLGYLSERIAKDFGLPFVEVPVGFKYVAEKILEGDVLIGGEESGGYAFSRTSRKTRKGSITPERDGLLSALLLLEYIAKSGKRLSALLDELQKRYGGSAYLRHDIHLSRPIEDKQQFIARMQKLMPTQWDGFKVKEMRTLDGLRTVMEDGSWILLRPSGTEPLLRTYAEFPNAKITRVCLDKLSKVLSGVLKIES